MVRLLQYIHIATYIQVKKKEPTKYRSKIIFVQKQTTKTQNHQTNKNTQNKTNREKKSKVKKEKHFRMLFWKLYQ